MITSASLFGVSLDQVGFIQMRFSTATTVSRVSEKKQSTCFSSIVLNWMQFFLSDSISFFVTHHEGFLNGWILTKIKKIRAENYYYAIFGRINEVAPKI